MSYNQEGSHNHLIMNAWNLMVCSWELCAISNEVNTNYVILIIKMVQIQNPKVFF